MTYADAAGLSGMEWQSLNGAAAGLCPVGETLAYERGFLAGFCGEELGADAGRDWRRGYFDGRSERRLYDALAWSA